MKPEQVKIINIIVNSDDNYIYGLGDDNLIYIYIASTHTWKLWG